MPTVATMTDPLPGPLREPKGKERERAPSESSSGRSAMGPGRRRKKPVPTHTVFLNIGRIDIPRSLPPVRSLGTQTDESALSVEAEENKKWHRRALKWGNKWVLPVLRCGVAVLGFALSRIGFGFRLN